MLETTDQFDFTAARKEAQNVLNTLVQNSGFTPRPAQKDMMTLILDTLDPGNRVGARIAAIEGQTGTGKSVAYLASTIPAAQRIEKTVVIATATIALQQQLMEKDLPEIQQRAGLSFDYRLAKGRGRYLCPRNLLELTGSNTEQASLHYGEGHESIASWDRPPKDGEIELVNLMESQLSAGQWDGDLDEFGKPVEADLRTMLTTSNAACSGQSCRFFNACPFYRARRGLRETEVIVANQDLVLSDLALGGGVLLPAPEDCVYVFDEAHHLPNKALEHLSHRSRLQSAKKTLEQVSKIATSAAGVLKTQKATEQARIMDEQARDALTYLKHSHTMLQDAFPAPKSKANLYNADQDESWVFSLGQTPEAFRETGQGVASASAHVCQHAQELLEALKSALKEGSLSDDQAAKPIKNLGFALNRIEELSVSWQLWSQPAPPDPRELPMARWVQRPRSSDEDITIAAASLTSAHMLRERLWNEAHAVILTSATLTALNSFDRFRRCTGLSDKDGTVFQSLPSPFDYEQQGVLRIPYIASDPSRQRDEHTQEIIDYLNREITSNEAALVLFSSRAQMNQVHKGLSRVLKNRVLVQGSQSRAELLTKHQKRVEQGSGSVIFGLASFAEGVDLRGSLCTRVVITKIPFSPPDSPIEQAQREYLENRGINPFEHTQLPDASLRLVQAVGRLIRSESDSGAVVILDRRIVTKRYGSRLLASLPAFRHDIEKPVSVA